MDRLLNLAFGCVPARLALAVMAWLGFFNLYMVRINLSVIIVAMVGRNASHATTPPCLGHQQLHDNTTIESAAFGNDTEAGGGGGGGGGEMDWSEPVQGQVLGAFFYGYTITQVLGGRLAEVYGSRVVFGLCILAGGLCTVVSPAMARAHYTAYIALRVFQGAAQGVSWPAMHACLARWIPPTERPRFIGYVYYGSTLSSAVTMPLCGWLVERYGWDTAFYVTGSLSLAWCVLWFSCMYDSPAQHPRISQKELRYIEDAVYKTGTSPSRHVRLPWRKMLTSMPVWAIVVADTGSTWGMFFFVTQLPTFMNNILGFSIKNSGVFSALPFLVRYASGIMWGTLCDWLVSRRHLRVGTARKLFSILALWGPAVMVVGVIYSGCNWQMTVAMLCLAMLCNSAMAASVTVNHTDIAPNFAGTVFGLGNTTCSVGGFIMPAVVGVLTEGQQTMEQWQKVFWIFVPIYGVAELFYLVFSSGTVQPWNNEGQLGLEDGHGDGHDPEATKLYTSPKPEHHEEKA